MCSAANCGYITPTKVPDDTDTQSKVQCLNLQIQQLRTHAESVHASPSVSRSQPTDEMHSQSLRLQGSPIVPPSFGGATLGPSSPVEVHHPFLVPPSFGGATLGPSSHVEVHHLFLGQDSLVQAPVLEKPAYSPLSHSPSLNFAAPVKQLVSYPVPLQLQWLTG